MNTDKSGAYCFEEEALWFIIILLPIQFISLWDNFIYIKECKHKMHILIKMNYGIITFRDCLIKQTFVEKIKYKRYIETE